MAKIKIKNSLTPGAVPAGLSLGEMAVNISDKKIFIGNAVEGVVTLHDQNNIITSVNGYTGNIFLGRGITTIMTGITRSFEINYSALGVTGLSFSTAPAVSSSDKILVQRKPSDKMELILVGDLLGTPYTTSPANISGSIASYRFAFFDSSGNQYSASSSNVQDEILNPTVRSFNGQTGHIQLSYVSSISGMTGTIKDLPGYLRDDIYIYARQFNDGTINYASQSNYISESAWVKSGLTYSKNIADPFGQPNNAWTLTRVYPGFPSSSTLTQTFSNTVSPIGSVSFYVKGATGSTFDNVSFFIGPYVPSGPGSTAYVEIISGPGALTGSGLGRTVTGLTSGEWTRILIRNGINNTITSFQLDPTYSFTGASGAQIAFFGLQYEEGLTATTYVDNSTNFPYASGGITVNAIGISYSGIVSSVNGDTGVIINVAKTNVGNTFSQRQEFQSGITAGGNSNFHSIAVTNGINAAELTVNGQIYGQYITIDDGGNPTSSVLNNSDLYFGDYSYYYSNKYIHIHNEVSDGGGLVSVYSPSVFYEGVTFTGNIYAPNIVTSVNGQTGDVTVTGSSTDGVTGIVAGNGISVSGQTGNVTITNVGVLSFNGSTGAIIGVSSINGSTGAITNVARLNEGNTFSARQIMNAGISAANLTVNSGVTFNNIDLQSNTATVQGYNNTGYLKMQAFGNVMGIPGNPSIVLQDADTDLGGIPNITINPSPAILANNTIAIGNSNTATTLNGTLSVGSTSTFTGRSTHTAGITSANLYVSGGVTFSSTTSHNGLASFSSGISASNASASNVIDVIAVNDGTGLRIAQADTGGNARVGSVRLGRSVTNGSNVLLEGYVGTFRVYNGISGTANNPGTKMLELSTTNAQFGVPIAGATFSSVAGEVSIQKTVLGANDSAYLRIVATDSGSQAYNSDIKGNTAAGVNTVHTLPATTGTLLNSNFNSYVSSFNGTTGAVVFNNYVSSINGATGAVTNINAATVTATATNVNATRYLTFVGGAGDTGIFIDPTTTPLTYTPAGGAIGAKKVTLTTSANVITVDSATPNIVLTDGVNTSTFGIDSFAANNSTPFTVSNAIGLTLSSNVIAFEGSGYGYVFPASNGSNGQVLTTNGAGTLSWSTVSGGGGSATGFTYASSAPGTPTVGDRWIDSDTGKEYVYVNDGSSSQWIEPVSSNGLVGVTYTSSTNFLEFGVTGSFVKLGVNNTSPQYTLDVNGIINAPVGISAGPITSSGARFSGAVVSDGGYRITSSAINAQTGTTYTLLTSDNGKIITMSNSSAITLTVPAGLPIGYNTTVIQLGAGQVGITASSTTLNSFEGKLKLAGQHAAASIISYTTNVFNVAGGLTA